MEEVTGGQYDLALGVKVLSCHFLGKNEKENKWSGWLCKQKPINSFRLISIA